MFSKFYMNTASGNKKTEILTQAYEELLLCNACNYIESTYLAVCVSVRCHVTAWSLYSSVYRNAHNGLVFVH
jgi:hypothetical protein